MMTDNEICREYRMAKDKEKQIGIIADQCGQGITRDEIIKVLVDCGEMEAPAEKEAPKGKTKKAAKQPQTKVVPKVVIEILWRRLDELDKLMKPLEDQHKAYEDEHETIVAFLRGCGQEAG